jgi:Family of unknown function (DUF6356)
VEVVSGSADARSAIGAATPMLRQSIERVFLDHPHAAGQSYVEHLGFAWRFAGSLLLAAAAAFIHGCVPALHASTAGDTVRRLYRRLESRGTTLRL